MLHWFGLFVWTKRLWNQNPDVKRTNLQSMFHAFTRVFDWKWIVHYMDLNAMEWTTPNNCWHHHQDHWQWAATELLLIVLGQNHLGFQIACAFLAFWINVWLPPCNIFQLILSAQNILPTPCCCAKPRRFWQCAIFFNDGNPETNWRQKSIGYLNS